MRTDKNFLPSVPLSGAITAITPHRRTLVILGDLLKMIEIGSHDTLSHLRCMNERNKVRMRQYLMFACTRGNQAEA